MVTPRADRRCEACSATEDRDLGRWLEVHERWRYDEPAHTQILGRLICLCTNCHTATHFGLAGIRGRDAAARRHLMTVTGMTEPEINDHIDIAFELWHRRSRLNWALDLSMLTDASIPATPPPTNRADEATTEVRRYRP